jgi:aminodeoxyfutalosine synthase
MTDADVLTLGMAADDVRRATLGGIVTYLRVHDVMHASAGAAATASAPPERAGETTVPDAAGEVRLHGLPASLDEALSQVRALRAAAGSRRLVAFSWADLAERGWDGRAELRAFADAGLDDVAELPVDLVADLDGALEVLTVAGLKPERLTVSRVPAGDRAALIRRVQRAFDAARTLRRFAPLPRVAPIDKPTTGYDDVRMVALARLALPGRSVEVDWHLYGPKLAQVALTFGADHLDAVSAVDDTSRGPRRTTIEDVERNIRAAGFEPREYRPGR